jgi:putative spermidine/putrescine transport system permease protein
LPFLGIIGWSVTLPDPGMQNYVRIVDDENVRDVLIRTFRICTTVSCAAIILAFLLAYTWVYGSRRWRWVIELGVFLPFWLSVLVRTFGWLIALKSNGALNGLLVSTGLISSPLQLTRNEAGVIIGMIHFMVPFAFFPLLQTIRRVDARTLLAARGLGASRLRTFLRIFLPQTVPGLIGAFIMVFVFTIGFFIIPVLLGGGQTVMVAEYIYLQMFQTSNWGLGAALSVVLLLVVAVLGWGLIKITRVGSTVQDGN